MAATEASAGRLHMLRIEVDGHFHGSSDVPRPWAARITGPSPKFGLAREFVDPMNDWRDARKAWSGNTYGVVATFPLREGYVYEVARLRGRSSKRHLAREFFLVADGKMEPMEPMDALARVTGVADGVVHQLTDDRNDPPWIIEISTLAERCKLGFVVEGGARRYLLRRGALFAIRDHDGLRMATTSEACGMVKLTQRQALEYMLARCANG